MGLLSGRPEYKRAAWPEREKEMVLSPREVPVMRKEAVFTFLLNVVLFPGMQCVLAQDPRYLRFSLIEDGVTTNYNLRVCHLLSCSLEYN